MPASSPRVYHKQSGVLPVYQGRIVLVTTKDGTRWILPKGSIPWELNARESAAREALEEGGIKGTVHPKAIGTYRYQKQGQHYRVRLYWMEVTKLKKHWDEDLERRRKAFKPEKAVKKVVPKAVSHIMERFIRQHSVLFVKEA